MSRCSNHKAFDRQKGFHSKTAGHSNRNRRSSSEEDYRPDKKRPAKKADKSGEESEDGLDELCMEVDGALADIGKTVSSLIQNLAITYAILPKMNLRLEFFELSVDEGGITVSFKDLTDDEDEEDEELDDANGGYNIRKPYYTKTRDTDGEEERLYDCGD